MCNCKRFFLYEYLKKCQILSCHNLVANEQYNNFIKKLWPQNKWLHTPRTTGYRHTRQYGWIQRELAFRLAKNATKPNPFETIPLQKTNKENNWKTEEVLVRAAVTVETERIKGSNPWCLWWWRWWWLRNYMKKFLSYCNLFHFLKRSGDRKIFVPNFYPYKFPFNNNFERINFLFLLASWRIILVL